MPHIVFERKIDLMPIFEKFNPIFEKSDHLIRLKDIYLNPSKNNALISTLVIDDFHQEFFIEVLSSDMKTTIRLFPITDPNKTDSVKISMVLIAKLILEEYPDLKITKTNLRDYLTKKEITC